MNTLSNKLVDKNGKPIAINNPLKKQAFSLYNSIYEMPNMGRYRPRWYVNQDSETGASSVTRDLLLRWSKEMYAQTPFLTGGIRLLSRFVVGKEYKPIYKGTNKQWGDDAIKWLNEDFYPNCCIRGSNFDFQTVMNLMCQKIDVEGDMLLVFGEEKKFPKIQIIPSHRIQSLAAANSYDIFFPTSDFDGGSPIKTESGAIISDGVVYNPQGKPLGYMVHNPENLVNGLFCGNNKEMFFSTKNTRLIYDPEYFDRGRGFPTISPGILQCLSLSEIEAYLMDKIKIQSMLAYIEKTPEGEGPYEEAVASRRMFDEANGGNGNNTESRPASSLFGLAAGLTGYEDASKGLRVVTNPSIRYVTTAGGDVKSFAATTTDAETSAQITRLETHILSTIGIPHVLLFSQDDVAGKMNESVIKILNTTIDRRQCLLDKHARFILAWAVSKAVKNGDLKPNDAEKFTEVFDVSHPQVFSLNDSKINQDNLAYYNAKAKSLTELCASRNTSIQKLYTEIEAEQIAFYTMAENIASKTGEDITTVLQRLNVSLNQKTNTFNSETSTPLAHA